MASSWKGSVTIVDAAGAQLGNRRVDVGHDDAEMMIAGIAQAVGEVGIGRRIDRQRVAAAEDLDHEPVVVGAVPDRPGARSA